MNMWCLMTRTGSLMSLCRKSAIVQSATMTLLIFIIAFLQAVLIESLTDVPGYLGGDVTLPSGANPSWNLSKIEWSIFSNITWIATYRNGQENIERFYLYKGRLSLNISSGDLTIHNLTTKDAMEYSVDLISTDGQDSVNKIKLVVKRRLQNPTIQTVALISKNGSCCVLLNCSSADEGVDFTWQIKPPGVAAFPLSGHVGNAAVQSALLHTTPNSVEFTCTSSRKMENASSVITLKCDDDKPQPQQQSRSRYSVIAFVGGILGSSLTIFLIYCFGEQIKAVWEYVKEKWFPSQNSA
ncbi:T-lymphocyte surface antigen Ly-9 [Chelmon rostratus]|uniref:T-lymphocyte surface antigen Ly-9 n=1 Tax=Chelmon rostratus TaxID=109905 RepID=UPI001BEC0F32|nr:T-lymphocyte surface antigen Ly-9 [Chelmon rostratus]